MRAPGQRLLAWLPVAVLAGCAALPPRADAPDAAAAPPAWVAALPPAAAGPTAPPAADSSDWWQDLGDAALNDIVQATLAASPDLATAAARVARARAALVAADAALLPQLGAQAAAQQGRQAPGAPTAASAQLGAQASWEIDLFGGGRAGAEAARARLLGARAQAFGVRAALAAEAANTVVAQRACAALVQLARDDARSREATARLSALTSRAGLSAPADAALADASAALARSQAVAQEAVCEAGVKALVELTAWSEAVVRERLSTATSPAAVPEPRIGVVTTLPAALLQRRPDLIDAAAAVQAAAADRAAAQAADWPRLSLSGSIAAASARSLSVTQNGSVWSLGPVQMSLPLFDGGTRRANQASARAEYDAAVAQAGGALRRAVREVEQALVALDGTRQRGDDTARAAAGFDAALRATEQRHRGGLASQFELEDARRSAVSARRAVVQLQQERAVAWIDLQRALGGGWPAQALAASAGR